MLESAEKELITKLESMCFEFLKRAVLEFEDIKMKYCGQEEEVEEGSYGGNSVAYF